MRAGLPFPENVLFLLSFFCLANIFSLFLLPYASSAARDGEGEDPLRRQETIWFWKGIVGRDGKLRKNL